MGKSREAGFLGCVRTETAFARLFTRYREARLIP